jgi:hypothetical protein
MNTIQTDHRRSRALSGSDRITPGPIATFFSFPNPVNELAARTVAAGVVAMSVLAIASRQGWPLIVIAYGFWARVATGPKASPLGQLAVRVVAPRLGAPRLVPGPPKRFAQAIGTAFSTAALVCWFGPGWHLASWVLLGMLAGAALLESAAGICLGCIGFADLMRAGVIPESVCEECAKVSLRHPELAA